MSLSLQVLAAVFRLGFAVGVAAFGAVVGFLALSLALSVLGVLIAGTITAVRRIQFRGRPNRLGNSGASGSGTATPTTGASPDSTEVGR